MGEEDTVQARPVPLLSPRSDFHIPLLPRCEGLPRYELHGLLNLLSSAIAGFIVLLVSVAFFSPNGSHSESGGLRGVLSTICSPSIIHRVKLWPLTDKLLIQFERPPHCMISSTP